MPMIVTLGTMYVYRGLAYDISNGEWAFPHMFTTEFMNITQRKLCGVNAIVIWTVLLLLICGVFLEYTKAGRRLFAVVSNEESAQVAGITISAVDGGTRVIALSPLVFHKGNMAEWVDKL